MKDLVQVYEHLQRISSYEDEAIKSWFSTDSMKGQISEFRENTFRTSYCLVLFNILKDNFSALQTDSQFFMKFSNTIGFVIAHLLAYKTILDPLEHPDFLGVKFNPLSERRILNFLYVKARYGNRTYCNMMLQKKDQPNVQFFCHREVLVYKLGHFKRMFEFDGREREALNSNQSGNDLPVVIIEDMSLDCLKHLLRFIYRGASYTTASVSILVHLCILSQNYIAPKLQKCAVDKMYKRIKEQKYSSEDIIEILREYSHLLYGNEEICNLVFPCLVRWSKDTFSIEKMKKIVKKGYDSFHIHSMLLNHEMENKEMKKEIEEMKKENEEMKKENEEMKRVVEGLRKVIKEKLGVDI